MEVKLSIITIVYNGYSKIERTIESVIKQNYKNFEYIIIDGGSTDGTVEIIKKYNKNINFWISEKDNGISNAFNKGLDHASGNFVGFINCGDIYENDVFSIISKKIKLSPSKNEDSIFHGNIKMGIENWKIYKPHKLNTFTYQMPIWHPTIFLSINFFKKYKFNEEFKIAMDYDLFSKLYFQNFRFIYIDETIACMDLDGVSNSNALNGFKEVMLASKKNLQVNFLKRHAYFYYRILLYKLMKIKKCLV